MSRALRRSAPAAADLDHLVEVLEIGFEREAALLAVLLRDRAAIRADLQARTGLELSAEDLETNLVELTRLFLIAP